jgi:NADPH:quinone reductase-like Zn-dependent oxidoreductase
VLRSTEGRGADLVLETGDTATFPQLIEDTALEGTAFIIGFLSGMDVSFNVGSVMEKRIRLRGNNTGSVADLADAAAAMQVHGIRPVLGASFTMDQAQAAYTHVAEGKHFGKVCDQHNVTLVCVIGL